MKLWMAFACLVLGVVSGAGCAGCGDETDAPSKGQQAAPPSTSKSMRTISPRAREPMQVDAGAEDDAARP